jgi:hypothetical protein
MKFRYSLAVLGAMLFIGGCTTSTLKKIEVTEIRGDPGDGLRLTARLESESAQQMHTPWSSTSLLVFFHPLLWHGKTWDIRRKESVVLQRPDSGMGVREDREIFVKATNSPFLLANASEMKKHQELIYRYVITLLNDARRKTGEEAETWDGDAMYEQVLAMCEQEAVANRGDDVFGRKLARLPYTVERAELPMANYTVTVAYTDVEVTSTGTRTVTYYSVTTTGSMPLLDPMSEFDVRIVRQFASLKSGDLLGTVDDTYEIRRKQGGDDDVLQPLLEETNRKEGDPR